MLVSGRVYCSQCRGIEWKGSSGHHSNGRCMDDWPQVTWQGDSSISMMPPSTGEDVEDGEKIILAGGFIF